jgi:hypothetical protein
VWPEPVERLAEFLRASGTEGRIEEVLSGSEPPPGLALSAAAFDCEGRTVVGLVPASRDLDPEKLAAAAKCAALEPAGSTASFPFQGADVFLESSTLASQTVWLELPSPRHFLGFPPGQLLRLTQARTADLLAENRIGGG